MQKFYADAFFSGTTKIMGLELKPLTLGHALVLSAIESPYITATKPPNFGDFVALVWICSRDWTESRDALVADTFKVDCAKWLNTQANLDESNADVKALTDYLETYLQVAPRYESRIKNGEVVGACTKPVRVPWPLAAAWTLMGKMTEEQAWTTPVARAFAYLAAESMYDDTLMTEEPEEETADGNSGNQD